MRLNCGQSGYVNAGIHLALEPPRYWEVVYVAMDAANNWRSDLQFFVPHFTGVGCNECLRAHRSADARR
jgi:hypothetical protein